MGEALEPANQVTLQIAYGDRSGAVAGLALWQDDQPVRQLDIPPHDGRWTVTLPAVPGSFLYAVATQRDGDFAITAPLVVRDGGGGSVVINEVLPAPGADWNGDGSTNSDDEFIELYNTGDVPVSLAGRQLSDDRGDATPGRRFSFGPGRFIGGHEYLALWRTETRLALNDSGDHVRLLDANGAELDRIDWAQAPAGGRSLSRFPDGQGWVAGTLATPGRANRGMDNPGGGDGAPPAQDGPKQQATHQDKQPDIGPTYGQASGPPASLALAKLRGLAAPVEFRAQVTVPPGLFNSAIYVADPAPLDDGAVITLAGLGIQVYLDGGEFRPLREGDWVLVRGFTRSYRGEMEVSVQRPDQVWRFASGKALLPLAVTIGEIGESLEGRLVTLTGVISRWQGDSFYLIDPATPQAEAVRVTVRSSLDWQRPYVNKGEVYRVTGVVSQFAQKAPWNGGYRVLVRYQSDIVKLK